MESHCLDSGECLWLDDNVLGGVCYCAETDQCEVCNGQTPAPTYSGFECPKDCKVYYVGCASMYCNCFGNCSSAAELGCKNPFNPHCHIWYTDYPTANPSPLIPTFPKSVYWGCRLCCLMEREINRTILPVAGVLELNHNVVKIKSYKMVSLGSKVDQQWEILYVIGLEEEESTGDIISNLKLPAVLNNISEYISRELDIQLEPIDTTYLGEDDPTTNTKTLSSYNSTGATVGGIIGGLCVLCLFVFVIYRKLQMNKIKMAIEELYPAEEYDDTAL